MNTAETEKLYIKHAEDFRELLGRRTLLVEVGDGISIVVTNESISPEWHVLGSAEQNGRIPAAIAVAAMTEAWRQRLEKQHGLLFAQDTDGFTVYRGDRPNNEWLDTDLNAFTRDARRYSVYATFNALPHAICAAVKALAVEKREKDKAKEQTHQPFGHAIIERLEKSEADRDERIRQIVRDELARTKREPISVTPEQLRSGLKL